MVGWWIVSLHKLLADNETVQDDWRLVIGLCPWLQLSRCCMETRGPDQPDLLIMLWLCLYLTNWCEVWRLWECCMSPRCCIWCVVVWLSECLPTTWRLYVSLSPQYHSSAGAIISYNYHQQGSLLTSDSPDPNLVLVSSSISLTRPARHLRQCQTGGRTMPIVVSLPLICGFYTPPLIWFNVKLSFIVNIFWKTQSWEIYYAKQEDPEMFTVFLSSSFWWQDIRRQTQKVVVWSELRIHMVCRL